MLILYHKKTILGHKRGMDQRYLSGDCQLYKTLLYYPCKRVETMRRSASKSMSASAFMRRIPETVRLRLPPQLRSFEWRARSYLVQLFFGSPAIHFEAWLLKRMGCIEIGLHFESRKRTVNERWFRLFDRYLIEVKAELGPGVELERWDKGWAKIYETVPLAPLDEALLDKVADRLARMISVLQPISERGQNLSDRPDALLPPSGPARQRSRS